MKKPVVGDWRFRLNYIKKKHGGIFMKTLKQYGSAIILCIVEAVVGILLYTVPKYQNYAPENSSITEIRSM